MRRRKVRKTKNINIPFKSIFVLITIALFLGFAIYYTFTVAGIKNIDKTKLNGSQRYLLSQSNGESKRTVIIIEKGLDKERKISEVYLFLSNKEKGKSLLVYIPNWLYFTGLEENFGSAIPISSFRYAGDTLQEDRGVEYSVWQISQILGITFNNYIYINSEANNALNEVFGEDVAQRDRYKEVFKAGDKDSLSEGFFKLQLISSKISFAKSLLKLNEFNNFNNNIYSNLSFIQTINLLKSVDKTLQSTESYAIDLASPKYSEEKLSNTGGIKRYFLSTEFDKSYRELISLLIDRELEKERVRVEVYNGSGVAGAAMQFGRKIENSGCDVVRYENAPKTIEKTVIYISKPEDFKKSFKIVSEIFSDNFDLVQGRPDFMTTGDIVIILGEDIKRMYSF